MGKGSGRRPTDEKAYQNNYEAIFGKKQLQCPKCKAYRWLRDSGKEGGGCTCPVDTDGDKYIQT